MKRRTITRFRDLLSTQRRCTVLCDCMHYTSIPFTTIAQMSREQLAGLGVGASFACVHCPDEPDEKTARQLWRDAGEPS